MVKVQGKLSHLDSKWDAKMEAILRGFKEEFRMEMHSLFVNYLGIPTASNTTVIAQANGKEVLGGPHSGFPPKDSLDFTQTSLGPTISSLPKLKVPQERSYR